MVASAASRRRSECSAADSAELDAEDLWSVIVAVLRRVMAEVSDPKAIRSVAVASVGEAGVLLGRRWPIARADHRLVRHPHPRRARLAPGPCRLRAPAPAHRAVCRPDLQPAQADLAQAPSARRVRRCPALAQRRRLSGLAPVRRARDRLSLASRTLLLDLEHGGWSAPLLECGLPSTLLPPLRPSGTDLGPRAAGSCSHHADCQPTASWASAGTITSAA